MSVLPAGAVPRRLSFGANRTVESGSLFVRSVVGRAEVNVQTPVTFVLVEVSPAERLASTVRRYGAEAAGTSVLSQSVAGPSPSTRPPDSRRAKPLVTIEDPRLPLPSLNSGIRALMKSPVRSAPYSSGLPAARSGPTTPVLNRSV